MKQLKLRSFLTIHFRDRIQMRLSSNIFCYYHPIQLDTDQNLSSSFSGLYLFEFLSEVSLWSLSLAYVSFVTLSSLCKELRYLPLIFWFLAETYLFANQSSIFAIQVDQLINSIFRMISVGLKSLIHWLSNQFWAYPLTFSDLYVL